MNRFEHSIGVSYLAGLLIDHIRLKQPHLCVTVGINEEIAFCVRAAGLLHDVGHGPFSHVFDSEVVPSIRKQSEKANECEFRHEDMSVKIIDHIFETLSPKFEITADSIELIKALVSPSTFLEVKKEYVRKKQGFLFQIIANDESGIDVDKWDYLLRYVLCVLFVKICMHCNFVHVRTCVK